MIHYHGMPMWPEAAVPAAFAAKHAMVSFERPEQIEIAAEVCQSIVLDNGAFSAWKKGVKYDFSGFREWITLWARHPAVDWFVIPDIIDGTEGANDMILHGWPHGVLPGVPVYHMHESLERLNRLVTRYPRVALGSSGEYAKLKTPQWWARMHEMMAVACDSDGMPRAKLHGLRMLDPVVFSQFPLSSADSCNVARNVGFDKRWTGPYVPKTQKMRALVMMDRIEAHGAAHRRRMQTDEFDNPDLIG